MDCTASSRLSNNGEPAEGRPGQANEALDTGDGLETLACWTALIAFDKFGMMKYAQRKATLNIDSPMNAAGNKGADAQALLTVVPSVRNSAKPIKNGRRLGCPCKDHGEDARRTM